MKLKLVGILKSGAEMSPNGRKPLSLSLCVIASDVPQLGPE